MLHSKYTRQKGEKKVPLKCNETNCKIVGLKYVAVFPSGKPVYLSQRVGDHIIRSLKKDPSREAYASLHEAKRLYDRDGRLNYGPGKLLRTLTEEETRKLLPLCFTRMQKSAA